MRMIVVSVISMSRCCRGRSHFQILLGRLGSLFGPRGPLAQFSNQMGLKPEEPGALRRRAPHCACTLPAEANVLDRLLANFFLACSTQVANSCSVTTRIAIGI